MRRVEREELDRLEPGAFPPGESRRLALELGVDLEDLPQEIRQTFPKPVLNRETVQPLSEVEKEYILAVLERNGGNQTRTAAQLKIGSATLYRKLKRYGIS